MYRQRHGTQRQGARPQRIFNQVAEPDSKAILQNRYGAANPVKLTGCRVDKRSASAVRLPDTHRAQVRLAYPALQDLTALGAA
jgi:hypothetical protein